MVRVYCFSLALLLQIAVGALVDGLTISIPAGNPSRLQDYLCNQNGSLPSNTTLQLQQGVHVISREGFCTVDMGLMNVRLIGAGLRETTIKCTRKWGFGFSSAQNVVVEGLTFDSCGAAVDLYNNTAAVLYTNSSQFVSVSNVSFFNIYGFGVSGKTVAYVNISDVFFGKCAAGTICVGASFTSDSYATSITINRCSFVGLGQVDRGSYRYLYDGAAGLQLQGHVVADIRDCSFVGNRGAGLYAIESNVSIFNCSFSGNVANRGAALNASSVRFLNVTGSRFYNNSAYIGAAIRIREQLEFSNSPERCLSENNSGENGAAIYLTSDAHLYFHENCIVNFSDNVATGLGGGNGVLPGVRLAPQQEVQWIGSECTALEYEIYGPQNTSVILQLSTKPGRNLHPIVMTLQWCEAGFALQKDLIGLLQCECSNFLSSFGVTCDINQGTVSRSGLQWIGLYTDGNEAIASTCPLRYCSANIEHMRLESSSDICAGGRVGVLCGQCPDGLSVVFGSAECQKCSDMWLLTILLYAIMGALLVAALFLLNITVTSGSLYGLIFYANILVVNGTIFFSHSYLMPLEIIVSLINLDLGFPLCFYNGMDDLSKTGLQFVFPAYLLLISFTIVVASKYCLNWSSTGSYSFVHRIRQSIGKRAVNVLATLIYLSYSKVLRTVIDIFTYADVYIHNNITAVKVWFYDGTVNYLNGKHIVLFSFAILASVFLFLFTLALTTIPIIVVHSENNVICKWLNKNVISLPVNDAYYSPFKGRWRIWLGARLWLVVILYSLGPFLGPQNPSLLLLIHAVLVIIFTFIQILIMPFGEAVFGTCGKYKGCSMYMLNMLDLFYLLNYSLLALIVSYLLTQDADIVPIKVVVGVFVGLSIVAFFCIVIFHAIVAIHKTWSRCNATPLNRSEILHPKDEEQPESIALAHHVEFKYDVLREPLLEDSSKYILNK
eukprot:Em0001g1410a